MSGAKPAEPSTNTDNRLPLLCILLYEYILSKQNDSIGSPKFGHRLPSCEFFFLFEINRPNAQLTGYERATRWSSPLPATTNIRTITADIPLPPPSLLDFERIPSSHDTHQILVLTPVTTDDEQEDLSEPTAVNDRWPGDHRYNSHPAATGRYVVRPVVNCPAKTSPHRH